MPLLDHEYGTVGMMLEQLSAEGVLRAQAHNELSNRLLVDANNPTCLLQNWLRDAYRPPRGSHCVLTLLDSQKMPTQNEYTKQYAKLPYLKQTYVNEIHKTSIAQADYKHAEAMAGKDMQKLKQKFEKVLISKQDTFLAYAEVLLCLRQLKPVYVQNLSSVCCPL